MTWVYLLRSMSFPEKAYIGLTTNLQQRLDQHNTGAESGYCAKYRPWKTTVAIRFEDRARANAFERYLKTGSGHAFAKRHFW
jgi:putative endonuclease